MRVFSPPPLSVCTLWGSDRLGTSPFRNRTGGPMILKIVPSVFAGLLFVSAPILAKTVPAAAPATGAVAPATEAAAATAATAVARPGSPAPEFSLPDASGKIRSLSEFRGKWVVLEWVNYDCPYVKRHYDLGNMQKVQKAARDKGAVWLSINSSAPGKQGYFTGEELGNRISQSKAQVDAYLLDPEGKVGRSYKAKTTPQMFVIDPAGKVVYAGAIDDRPSTDKGDLEGAKNYVQAALESGLAGKPVAVASTASYGCGVKYGDK